MEFYIPDSKPLDAAFSRVTHVGIGAHQDDLEIMAFHGILQPRKSRRNSFFGIVATDGAGSVRAAAAGKLSNAKFSALRNAEQKRAANIGRYGGVAFLNLSSADVKGARKSEARESIAALVERLRPKVIYTHNLADRHATHVAVALRTIEALRRVSKSAQPEKVYGCEVWRDLDWLSGADKVSLDVSGGDALALKLLKVFKSQNRSGKRYDVATLGRRWAHATYSESHQKNRASSVIFAMDLTPLIRKPGLNVRAFLSDKLKRFSSEALKSIDQLT